MSWPRRVCKCVKKTCLLKRLPLLLAAGALISMTLYLYLMNQPSSSSRGCASEEPLVFYVSPNGSDSWSGRLPEPSEDGRDGPFATITRA
ncbi:MAG: hypothetical protein J7L75_02515, partial [Thermoproteales archaeon]|nr:hypothetical protein [Thermoproteales archaeon]